MQPTPSQVHVDAVLTNISVAYVQSAEGAISDKVFPVVPVDFQTDKYYKFTKNDWFRDEMQRRAPSSESVGSGFTMSTDSYSCDVWALHKDIDDRVKKNADAVLRLESAANRWLAGRYLIKREKIFAETYFTAGIWGTTVTGGTDFTKWSDQANSDPIEDMRVARRAILVKTGFKPNVLALGYDVWEHLKKHPLILERYKYTSSASITKEMVANIFEVQKIVVAETIYATNAEGATEAYDFIQGQNALLAYVPAAPALEEPAAGYIMTWRGLTGLNNLGMTISNIRMDHLKSDRIEMEAAFDMKMVCSDVGYFFSDAVD
jgi:hypothetical protein